MRQAAPIFIAWSRIGVLAALGVLAPNGQLAATEADEPAPFRLELPEWTPDPAGLPEELQPLEIDRPALPEGVAEEVAGLEARIAELEKQGLLAETREARDIALDEALALAARVVKLRREHQGPDSPRGRAWREHASADWYEIDDARRRVDDLRRVRGLADSERADLASLVGTGEAYEGLRGAGEYTEAQEITERQLEVCRRALGDDHPDTLTWLSRIGLLLHSQGKMSEAEPYSREALAGRRHVLGDDHPNTLGSVLDLGALLQSQGKLSEAEPHFREALAGFRRVLGDDHPLTLTSVNNLGSLLYSQGKLSEAEPYFREALARIRRVLGDDDPSTLVSVNNLGALLQAQGKRSEAEPYYREALAGNSRVLGDDHPSTLTSVNNLGALLRVQGKLSEAEPYYREALAGRRRVLGDDHPDTLGSLNNLGRLLESQGKLSEAEPYTREALAGRRRFLGDDHPDTLGSVNNLGRLLESQGKLSEAEPYYREALAGTRRVLGDDHPNTLGSVNDLGRLLESQGKLSEAEPYYREALTGFRRVLGDDHPDTLGSVNNLGFLLQSQGKLSVAEPYYREALAGTRRVLGDDHPDTLSSVNNLGALLWAQGKLSGAEPYYREALAGTRRVLGDDHPDTLKSVNYLGALLRSQGKLSEAEPYSREALAGFRRVLGDDHPDTLKSVNYLGALLRSQGKLSEAEPYWREALASRRRVLGNDHPDTLTSVSSLGMLLESQGKLSEAEPYYREALATAERLRTDVLGDAASRAAYAGVLRLTETASRTAALLLETGRAGEAQAVLERGRGRAGLDMLSRDDADLGAVLAATGDAERLARHTAAVEAERRALTSLREAEARMSAVEDDASRAKFHEQVLLARRELGEKTAAVFAELRGLIPTTDPMGTEAIAAALGPGELYLSYVWTKERVLALWTVDETTSGAVLAQGETAVERLGERVAEAREAISSRAPLGTRSRESLAELARTVFPEPLGQAASRARQVVISPDGPLHGIPLDALVETGGADLAALTKIPISYAYSATAHLRARQTPGSKRAASGTIALGGAIFDRGRQNDPVPEGPETGVLLAMVQEGSNAATAGLQRGDVLLNYGGQALAGPAELGPAIATAAEALTTRGAAEVDERPIRAEVWRDGEIVEVALAAGRLGVNPSPAPPRDGLRSMRALDRAAEGTLAAEATALDQVRLFGGSLAPLPGTELEARAIAALAGDATLLVGEQATVGRLRAHIEGSSNPPRILHLATHGLLGSAERAGVDAALAFTQPVVPSAEDIGFLTLEELSGRWLGRLAGTELIVLSACDTGRGVTRGDTVMGLPLGFLAAGAKTVVASLWKVDDTATTLLMSRFYANLLGKTKAAGEGADEAAAPAMPKLEALREAQSWLRGLTESDRNRLHGADASGIVAVATRGQVLPRRGREVVETPKQTEAARPYDHPYYWAAFVLFGDGG